jgi:D-alanyl-D-alanine endopeptidase (penicillin-binding protein 7)
MYRNIFILLLSLWASQVYPKTIPITATSWIVADGTGRILQNENSQEVRSIASISKLMTVIVVLDAHQDLDEYIKPYTRRELIKLALVKSDNSSAKILCEKYPGGMASCIRAMNTKAHFNAMPNTNFIEPTGLSVFNVSTAEDLVKMVMLASTYSEIVESSKTSEVKIKIKKKWLIFHNTNPIIGKRHDFVVSKTGYIRASGGCIVMMLDTDVGRRIVIVLGSKNTHTRIPEAEFIANEY